MPSRQEIVSAAKTLRALLDYNGQGECPVSNEEAQRLWDEVSRLIGYSAVGSFLAVCASLDTKEGKG